DELLADDVPEEIKRQRNNRLLAIQNEISEEDNARLIGRDFEILVEGLSKSARKVGQAFQPVRSGVDAEQADQTAGDVLTLRPCPDDVHDNDHPQLVGRTTCDRIVVFDGNPRLIGNLTQVHIYDCTPTTLLGTIVTREFQHAAPSLLPILS